MRSVYDGIKPTFSLGPALITSSTSNTVALTTNGTSVDTKGLNSAMLFFGVGPATAAQTVVVTLQEAPDNATWTNANDNTGTVIGFTLVPGTTQGVLTLTGSARIEGLGTNRKRYLRVVSATTGTSAASTQVGTILMGRAYEEPEFGGNSAISNT